MKSKNLRFTNELMSVIGTIGLNRFIIQRKTRGLREATSTAAIIESLLWDHPLVKRVAVDHGIEQPKRSNSRPKPAAASIDIDAIHRNKAK